jgi:hypothetical protein
MKILVDEEKMRENVKKFEVDAVNLYNAVIGIPDAALSRENKVGLINNLMQNLEESFINNVKQMEEEAEDT